MADRILAGVEPVEGARHLGFVDRERRRRGGPERQVGDRHAAFQDLRHGRTDRQRLGGAARCVRQGGEQPVHPAIGGAAPTRRAALDEQLRVEMRAGRVGRAGGMDKRQLLLLP